MQVTISITKNDISSYPIGNHIGIKLSDTMHLNLTREAAEEVVSDLQQLLANTSGEEQEAKFYCQTHIEDRGICEEQCDHCKRYYKPIEQKEISVPICEHDGCEKLAEWKAMYGEFKNPAFSCEEHLAHFQQHNEGWYASRRFTPDEYKLDYSLHPLKQIKS